MAGALSSRGILRVRDVLERHVDAGIGPGVIAVISRGGEVCIQAAGYLAQEGPGSKSLMAPDTIFRAASWTKTVVAAYAMMLVEDGILGLADPVDEFLPEFSRMSVLAHPKGQLGDVVPANRSITLHDLLTNRIGTGTIEVDPGSVPISDALMALERSDSDVPGGQSAEDYVRRLGRLPLVHQPGERWMYYTPAIVLGVLVSRAGGKPLEDLLRERIFGPLGMKDSTLNLNSVPVDRLATAYKVDNISGARVPVDIRMDVTRASFKAASSGLLTTPDDFASFTSTLASGGTFMGERILSQRSVSLMTTDHLTAAQKTNSKFVWSPGFYGGFGWGYALGITTRSRYLAPSAGSYGWYGKYGTTWFNDPSEDMTTMLVCQTDTGWKPIATFRKFWAAVYNSIDN